MSPRFGGLWLHRDFLKLWSGHSVSTFGTLISRVALPFTAVLVLEATAFEMGLLRAAGLIPGFLIGLLAGVWVDRVRKIPLMIGADLARAVLLATVPVAALLGVLRIEQLYPVAFLVGALSVLFEVALLSYVPILVARERLVEANSKMQATESVAEVTGFGLAGALVQTLTAPLAVLIDAASFLVSAVSLALIRTPEPPTPSIADRQSVVREVREGLALVFGHPQLRPIALASTTLSFFMDMIGAVFLLFVTRELGVAPIIQGLIFGVGGLASLAGAVAAPRIVAHWGIGRTLALALLVGGAGSLFLPFASGPVLVVIAVLICQQLLGDAAITVFLVSQVSLRQGLTPDHLQGRMNASIRFLDWSAMLTGVLLGGLLGELVGLRPTILLAACGMMLTALWIVGSPLRTQRGFPTT